MKNRAILTESQLHKVIKESLLAILNEGKNDELINNIVNAVLNNDELLKNAYSYFSPRCLIFYKGTPKQQHKWRIEGYVVSNPEVFEGLMTFPLRKKAAEAVYNAIAQKYRL